MAYPTGTPVDELIMANVETTLAAIATPSFYTDVASCTRLQDGSALEAIQASIPAIIVAPPRFLWNDATFGMYRCVAEFTVRGVLWQLESHQTALSKFSADIKQALLADPTRGGHAVSTRITEHVPFILQEGAPPFIAVDLSVQVIFRHLFSDPNTAI